MGCKFYPKRVAVASAFKDERGTSERHCYFNDREKLLKGKDLRIFVEIPKKYYFF